MTTFRFMLLITPTACTATLHWVAGKGHADVVKVLLKAGADVEITEEKGNTALHLAIKGQLYNARRDRTPVVKLLMEAGADPDAENERGTTPRGIADSRIKFLTHPDIISRGLSTSSKERAKDFQRSPALA